MKSKALNTLKYTGVVTLSQYIGSKKIKIAQMHNRGGNPLFDFFTNCLIGEFARASASRPEQIALININGNDYESATGFIKMYTPAVKTAVNKVKYSFMMTKDKIESTTFTDLYIGLYTSGTPDLQDYAAICKVELEKAALINAALVVDWELAISNMPDAIPDTN